MISDIELTIRIVDGDDWRSAFAHLLSVVETLRRTEQHLTCLVPIFDETDHTVTVMVTVDDADADAAHAHAESIARRAVTLAGGRFDDEDRPAAFTAATSGYLADVRV